MNKILIAMVFALSSLLLAGSVSVPATISTTDERAENDSTPESNDSIYIIIKLAEAGDPAAMNRVGLWYYTGEIMRRDYDKAFYWWKKAALESDVDAIGNLGMCYEYGHGTERDSINALRLYVQSIKSGNMQLLESRMRTAEHKPFDAMLSGYCHENGVGCNKDLKKAIVYYGNAAELGSDDGMLMAGVSYLNVGENAKALEYFTKGAEYDNPGCLFWAGRILLGGFTIPEKPEQAIVYMNRAADTRMPAAFTELGDLYAYGRFVEANDSVAAEYYRTGAHTGNAKGMYCYATALAEGKGTPRDLYQALVWADRAASKGYRRAVVNYVNELDSISHDPFADYVLGTKAWLVDRDYDRAARLFKKVEKAKCPEGAVMRAVLLADTLNPKADAKKALKQLVRNKDCALASLYLGNMYLNGTGCAADTTKAVEYYTVAAESGIGQAQASLARMYYTGTGVDKDYNKAVDLYQKALDNMSLTADDYKYLAECYENGLGTLKPDRKKAAQLRKAKTLRPITELLKYLQ